MDQIIDLATWPRAAQYALFRNFQSPHYATTVRMDVTALMAAKAANGTSPYRGSLYAIGYGLHAVPELRTRFRGDVVTLYDRIALSMTVPRDDGSFGFGYLDYDPDFAAFDKAAQAEITRARTAPIEPDKDGRNDLAYLSCTPWLDYVSITNAMPSPEDCIPRIGWGKIVPEGTRYSMSMTVEVHHAIADGLHIGRYFEAVQTALDGFAL
ncbi:CatA-like O-acetyltransferase [Gymnodinialimonas hymeniacidonis]|uniref:CatA-like O-acetyltransferase n=1 Tax=Gymnodinialimonas hymeniacidonis TaxID=3126508 RepID=UPI0034C5FEB7